jgi:hypothetical protein
MAMATALSQSGIAWAAPEPKGFTIAPAYQFVDVRADQPQVEYNLQIRNHANFDQNFHLSVVDFGSLDEEGGVAFLGTPTSELEHKYGLASWMTLETDSIFVPIGQTANIIVHISNRPSLAPGGHYGAVLATAVTDTGRPGVGNTVGIKQVLASLVLATKEGGVQTIIDLRSQSSNATFWKLPSRAEARFENAGNVHVIPRGVVSVVDPWGRMIKRGALNEASSVILPESFRRYKTTILSVAQAWLPGRYKLVTQYRDEAQQGLKAATETFWYAGALVVWVALFFALAILWIMGWLGWRFWRRRKRRNMRQK